MAGMPEESKGFGVTYGLLLLVGVLSIALSLLLKDILFPLHSAEETTASDVNEATAAADKDKFDKLGERAADWVNSGSTYVEFFKEVGFASLIALGLAATVERTSRTRHEKIAIQQQKRISESVFKGVFNANLPNELVDEVTRTVLNTKLIRRSHTHTYTITKEETTVDGQAIDFIKFVVSSEYSLENVTADAQDALIRIAYPFPADKRLSGEAGFREIYIGGIKLDDKAIKEGDDAVENTDYVCRSQWKRKISSGDRLNVRATYVLVKEFSDSEIWRSLYPSMDMRLNVNMNCTGLEFGARSLHSTELMRVAGDGNTGHHSWILQSPALPHQGIFLWWRPKGEELVPPHQCVGNPQGSGIQGPTPT